MISYSHGKPPDLEHFRFQCMTELIFRHGQYLTSACVLLVNITVQHGEDQNSRCSM